MNVVLYIHGKGGTADESEHYKRLFPDCDVCGLDYKCFTPWEVYKEIKETINDLKKHYDKIILIANSIGAFFAMNADICHNICHAYFISPIVDMEKLITDMMKWANVTEEELRQKETIRTKFGEELSWKYLCYVKNNPITWCVPTDILYGRGDNIVSIDTIKSFVDNHNARLTIMENGEHWFHTEEQMQFLDDWIKNIRTENYRQN